MSILLTLEPKNGFLHVTFFLPFHQVAENVISTVDGIMNTADDILIQSNEQSNTSSNILSQLDTLATNQPATEKAQIIQRPNIGFGIIKPSNSKPIVIRANSKPTNGNSSANSSVAFSMSQTDETPDDTEDASIVLSSEVVGKASSKPIYSFLFSKPSLFLSRNGNLSVQSVVLSASVGDGVTIANLTDPVKLGFQTRKPNVTGLVNTCKFYDFKLQSKCCFFVLTF